MERSCWRGWRLLCHTCRVQFSTSSGALRTIRRVLYQCLAASIVHRACHYQLFNRCKVSCGISGFFTLPLELTCRRHSAFRRCRNPAYSTQDPRTSKISKTVYRLDRTSIPYWAPVHDHHIICVPRPKCRQPNCPCRPGCGPLDRLLHGNLPNYLVRLQEASI